MAYSTQEISENVKQARENALVGNYDESHVCYAGAIEAVKKMFKTTPDLDMKQKWKQVHVDLLYFFEISIRHPPPPPPITFVRLL